MQKIKNDLEVAVQEEFARLVPRERGPSQTALALKASVSSAVSRLAQSSLLSSRLPVERLTKLTTGLLKDKKRTFCQCPVCRVDTLALALTNLPPCYCRSEHFGIATEKVNKKAVEKAVLAAIHRVKMRPKHPGSVMVTDATRILLVNFGLKIGGKLVPPILAKTPAACRCALCQNDTLAFGLNQAPSKYGVSIDGKLRIPSSAIEFIRHEFIKTFADAAKKIATNPRHESTESS